jgi:molybdate transport system permease protein
MSAAEWSALALSLRVAVVATCVTLPIAIGLAYWLARSEFAGKWLIESVVSLPIVLPPVVTGYLLLVLFGRHGVLGSLIESTFGLRLVFDWKGAAIASAVMGFPLMVRAIRVAFTSVDRRLEEASRTLGIGPWGTFLHVTLPLAKHGVWAGALLGFARSLGEFGATVMIAGNIPGRTQTAPLYIYQTVSAPGGMEASARMVVLLALLAAVAVGVSEWAQRNKRTIETRREDQR